MKALIATLRKEAVVGVTCWELESHLFKALVLPTFTYGTKLWGGDLKNSHWKVFEKDMKIHMMSHVKVRSSTTYHILLAEFGELPMELYALKLTMGFQQRLAHLPSSRLVSQATSLSRLLAEQGFNTWHKSTTMWKASWGLSHWETHDNPTTSKITFNDIKEAFLAKEWNSFHLSGKKLDYLHLKDFLKYECELYLKQPLTPPQRKIIAAYRTSNHRLAIETGRWSTIPISRDKRLCNFCSYNVVENEAHFVLECPLYSSIRDKFQSLFENIVLGSIKSFFQLDHQVDISLYLTEATALRHSRELASLTPS